LSRIFARVGILVVLAFSLWQYATFDAQLPDTLAVHFGTSGRPDGWQSRQQFWIFSFGMIYGTWLFMAALAFLIHKTPDRWINLPNKAYWLAPERRDATLRRLSGGLEVFATVQAAWMAWLIDSMIRTNLSGTPELGNLFFWQLGLYLVALAIWMVWYIAGFFRRTEIR